jgi:hypothetical protein
MTSADRAIAAVEALLDRQRRALLAGDFDALAQMPDRLAQAMQQLGEHQLVPAQLEPLKALADQNARLLLAAQRGVAQTRHRHGGQSVAPLTTYDAFGHQAAATADGRLLSRR